MLYTPRKYQNPEKILLWERYINSEWHKWYTFAFCLVIFSISTSIVSIKISPTSVNNELRNNYHCSEKNKLLSLRRKNIYLYYTDILWNQILPIQKTTTFIFITLKYSEIKYCLPRWQPDALWKETRIPRRRSHTCQGIQESLAQFENPIKPPVYVRRITRSTKYQKAPFC